MYIQIHRTVLYRTVNLKSKSIFQTEGKRTVVFRRDARIISLAFEHRHIKLYTQNGTLKTVPRRAKENNKARIAVPKSTVAANAAARQTLTFK